MGVDILRAVHTAGAATHHYSFIALQQFPQAYLVDEPVLRGHVASAEDDPIGLLYQLSGLPGIAPLQHCDGGRPDAGTVDAIAHSLLDRVREAFVVGGGAYKQHPRLPAGAGDAQKGSLYIGEKSVILRKVIFPESGGTAGKI